MSEAFQCNRRK